MGIYFFCLFFLTTLNFEAPVINILNERLYFNRMLYFALFGIKTRYEICNYYSFFILLRSWIDAMIQLMNNQLIFFKKET